MSKNPFAELSNKELDARVAEALALKEGDIGGVPVWLDETGTVTYFVDSYSPTTQANEAIELLRLLAADGNGIAINTSNPLDERDAMSIGGFPKTGNVPLPFVTIPLKDIDSFGEFKDTLLRAICSLFVLYKGEKEEGDG